MIKAIALSRPTDTHLGFLFQVVWAFAHAIAWVIFVPIFSKLAGGQDYMFFFPNMTASANSIIYGYLIIVLVEGICESLVLLVFQRKWMLWLPATLAGGMLGALLASPFEENFFVQTGIVMSCVSIMQWIILSLESKQSWVLPAFKGLIIFILSGSFPFFLIVVGFGVGAIYFAMGFVFGIFSSIGMRIAQNNLREPQPTQTLIQRLRRWQIVILAMTCMVSFAWFVVVHLL